MSDNAWTKVAQAVIRLVAFALVVTSLLLFVGDLYNYYKVSGLNSTDVQLHETHYVIAHYHVGTASLILKAFPLLIGAVLLCTSRRLAEHLTKDLE